MGFWQRQMVAYHPVVGWWWIPNMKAIGCEGEGRPYFQQTNSFGMRSDREYPLKCPGKRRRIVLLGDSFTAGYGISNSNRFSSLLEESFPNLDVMNFGLSGSGTDQQLLIYETLAKSFEADSYILAFSFLDISRNLVDLFPITSIRNFEVWYRPKPCFTLDCGRLVLHNVPVPTEPVPEKEGLKRTAALNPNRTFDSVYRLIPEWIRRNAALRTVLGLLIEKHEIGYECETSQPWQLMRAIIESFKRQVSGKPVFIVPFPSVVNALRKVAPIYLSRFAELHDPTENCFVVDVLPYFRRLSHETRRNCFFEIDGHFSPLGHQVVAEAISGALTKHCPDLLGLRERIA
jgi:carbamoyltransferase